MDPLVKTFSPGEIIFHEGLQGSTSYVIRKGRVEISILREGRKVVLDVLGKNAVFGEMAPLLGGARSATATALDQCETYCFQPSNYVQFLDAAPPLLKVTLEAVVGRLRRMNERASHNQKLVFKWEHLGQILEYGARVSDPLLLQDRQTLPLQETIDCLCAVGGLDPDATRDILEELQKDRILEIDPPHLRVCGSTIVQKAQAAWIRRTESSFPR